MGRFLYKINHIQKTGRIKLQEKGIQWKKQHGK